MKNIVVIFGGASVEHDISVLTGLHAARNILDDNRVILAYLSRDGQIMTSGDTGILSKIDNYINGNVKKAAKAYFSGGCLYRVRKLFGAKKVCKVDAVLNCCHGGGGEDGRLAGMLDMMGVPVTSCEYVGAAALQSKSRTREILSQSNFLQPDYKVVKKGEPIPADIKFPVIVKPDTLGSSIGISVAHTEQELTDALEVVFALDKVAVVEQFLEGAEEINCSAFRCSEKVWVSKCEVIKKDGEVFDFDTKYLDTESGFVKKSGREEMVHEKESEIQELAKRAYELFGARGVVRADFLVVGDKVYLNEINTVPGFLSYHLWMKTGLPYGTLIDMLVTQAQIDAKNVEKLEFTSEILQKNRNLVQ